MPFLSDKIVDLYCNQKLSGAAIAEQDGRSESTIYNILRAKNIKCRNRSQANKIFSDRLFIKLYNLALSCSQIGRLLGVHPSTVIKRLRNCKFAIRDRHSAKAIRYTEQEFEEFFCNATFMDQVRLFARQSKVI